MPIHCGPIHNWDDYNKILRQFTLSDLLKKIGMVSYSLLYPEENGLTKGAKFLPFHCMDSSGGSHVKPALVSGWGLIDLAYHAILSSNDYRGKKIESSDELNALCALEWDYHSIVEKPIVDKIGKSPDFWCYVLGMLGEQMKLQTPGLAFDNAARDMYILLDIGKKAGGIDVESVVYQEVGVEWKVLCASLLLAWSGFSKCTDINDIIKAVRWDKDFTQEAFLKVFDRYVVSYDEVRKGSLGRQIFYTKPYVRSQRNEIISINGFLNLFIFEHCLLWIVRDHYLSQNSQRFVSDFGMLFEEYVGELFSLYLADDQYARIPEDGKEKRADWKVSIAGYDFLIEQKSSILRLAAKQQHSEYQVVTRYIEKTVQEAVQQLEDTEKSFGGKEYIKMVLLYEDYLGDGVVYDALNAKKENPDYAKRYWFVKIGELERLLYLYHHSPEQCAEVIRLKKENDEKRSDKQKNLDGWLEMYDDNKNQHLRSGRAFEYYLSIENYLKAKLRPNELRNDA